MKRLLCIVGSMNAGGAETFLMKIHRELDKSKYQMDYCVTKPGIYDDEIKELGGKEYVITPKTKGPIKAFNSIVRVVREGNYDYVMRISQNSLSSIELIAAKKGGAKRTIYRSSNSQACGGMAERILHKLFLPLSKHVPDVKIAPSTEAAEFMFGKECIARNKAFIVHNAIKASNYRYSINDRNRIRKEFDICNKRVIGHIGRFNYQKNHSFIIKVFKKIYEMDSNSVLLLVGTGELQEAISDMCSDYGIDRNVIMAGVRKDIPALLSAMDVFVLPSLFEGLPNTLIEAQANGMQCIISDSVTKEARITNLVTYFSLSDSVDKWAQCILEKSDEPRTDTLEDLKKNKYDIETVVDDFENMIFEAK